MPSEGDAGAPGERASAQPDRTEEIQLPTSGTLRVAPRLPLSVRLIGRSSLPGAGIVLGLALLLVVGVPWLVDRTADAEVSEGDSLAVAPRIEISLAEGWSVGDDVGQATVLVNGSANLYVATGATAGEALEGQLQEALADFEEDPNATWVFGDPVQFATDVGDPGVSVSGTSETQGSKTWVVAHGTYETVAVLTAPLERWSQVEPDAARMVASLALSTPAPASDAGGAP